MAQFLKPNNLNNVWASGGDRIYPGDTKYAIGWQVEIPPRQYFNEIDYKQDQMLAHLNQYGIPIWDNETEYQADQSYVQGSTGTVYRCILTHTNQNPDLDVSNTYWIIAFASAGDFYTASQSDARYAQLSNNGSDYNIATFRNNIQVYSRAETYTRTEVDSKTTIASALQAQTLESNNVLISALRLADAFKGVNQSIGAIGFQKLPGGLIVQWGTGITNASGQLVVTLPQEYQTAHLIALSDSGENSGGSATQAHSLTTTSLTVRAFNTNSGSPLGASPVTWFSLGH